MIESLIPFIIWFAAVALFNLWWNSSSGLLKKVWGILFLSLVAGAMWLTFTAPSNLYGGTSREDGRESFP